jgi:TetR/AcrR family transcriptional regulator
MKETRAKPTASDVAVRDRLLAGAADLFTRKGYNGTTVREIVAFAGVTKPVLYYYFRNKEGIYIELIRGAFAKFDALLDETRKERGKSIERLLRFSDRVFALFMENIKVARLMYSIYYGPPQGAPFFDFDALHLRLQEAVRSLIRKGIRQGELPKGNVEDRVWIILGAVNMAMEINLSHPERAIDRKGFVRILNLILRGFQQEGRRR